MSRDNTMLARLGFQDPDRKSGRHDEICRQVYAKPEGFIQAARAQRGDVDAYFATERVNFRPELERPLFKGEGKYQTIVGYLDVCVWWTDLHLSPCNELRCGVPGTERWSNVKTGHPEPYSFERPEWIAPAWVAQHEPSQCSKSAIVEVKTGKVDLGDWLRQMKTYKTYTHADLWILLAPNMTDVDVKIFADAGVTALTWDE